MREDIRMKVLDLLKTYPDNMRKIAQLNYFLNLSNVDRLATQTSISKGSDNKELTDLYFKGWQFYTSYEYGPEVKTRKVFFSSGLRWQVVHYRQHLNLLKCDVAICGHTHRPFVERDEWTGTLVMNPGSPTYPRGSKPSMGRILCEDGRVVDAQIIEL